MTSIVIAGTVATGKSTLAKKAGQSTAIDLQALLYKRGDEKASCLTGKPTLPVWPQNYCDQIEKMMWTVDIVMVSPYPEVIVELLKRGIEVVLVHPDLTQRAEYRQRCIDRGNNPDLVQLFDDHFVEWITAIEAQQGCQRIVLKSGQYLSDVIEKIVTK